MTPSQETERKVSKAKSLLILDHPFFGTAVSKRPIQYTDNVPTAAVSATGQIYMNPAFIDPLSVKQIMFLMAHEAMHYMLSHALRRKHRDHSAWNVACDKVINDTLIDAGVGEFIDGGITLDNARQYAAEQLYDESDNQCGGIGMDIGDPTDDNGNPLDESQLRELEAQGKVEMLQAAQAAKEAGKLPSSVQRLVDEMTKVNTPWHEILERFMHGKIRDDRSWNRPNRRFMHTGLYLPGTDFVPRMGEIVIAVDTSGSLTASDLSEFAAHINRVLETCHPEKVHVVYCDSAVQGVTEYTPDDYPVKLLPVGGGGTSFSPVFDWVSEQPFTPEVVVYLTDGYGDQHHIKQPSYDVVWLTTDNADFPFGTVVTFNK